MISWIIPPPLPFIASDIPGSTERRDTKRLIYFGCGALLPKRWHTFSARGFERSWRSGNCDVITIHLYKPSCCRRRVDSESETEVDCFYFNRTHPHERNYNVRKLIFTELRGECWYPCCHICLSERDWIKRTPEADMREIVKLDCIFETCCPWVEARQPQSRDVAGRVDSQRGGGETPTTTARNCLFFKKKTSPYNFGIFSPSFSPCTVDVDGESCSLKTLF